MGDVRADESIADPVIQCSLAMIADDEAVHAELAWEVVALCAARGGAPVRTALVEAAGTLRAATFALPELDRRMRRRIAQARVAAVRARLSSLLERTATAAAAGAPADRRSA